MILPTCTICDKETSRYHTVEEKRICHPCWALQQPNHIICRECGTAETPSTYAKECAEKLRERQLCHGCSFWADFATKVGPIEITGLELLRSGELSPEEHAAAQQTLRQLGAAEIDQTIVRVGGKHYQIAPEKQSGMRGFGGAKFLIRFFDGRSVETTNLWSQGTIPEHFRSRLPDNAEFLPDPEKERQREKIREGLRRSFRKATARSRLRKQLVVT